MLAVTASAFGWICWLVLMLNFCEFLDFLYGTYICTNNLVKDSSISRNNLILWGVAFFGSGLDYQWPEIGLHYIYMCFYCSSPFHLMWYINFDRFCSKVLHIKMQSNLGNSFWKILPLLNHPSWRSETSVSLETLYHMFIFILMEKLSFLAFHIFNLSKSCSNGLW